MNEITPQPGIMDIALYTGGKSTVEGVSNVVKLSSNENPFGPSPAAQEAVRRVLHEMHRYPLDRSRRPCGRRSARRTGSIPTRIICGVGSDEIIHFLCQAYAGPGDEVVHTEHGFGMYKISARVAGATPVEVPEAERVTDVDALLAACTERTTSRLHRQPEQPHRHDDRRRPRSSASRTGCRRRPSSSSTAPMPNMSRASTAAHRSSTARSNVVMTRTFSKLYGLGGMRVGWGYAPAGIIDVLTRVRGPFNLSAPALAAAEAAIRDTAFTEKSRAENTRMRTWLAEALMEHGVPSDTSCANFILARFASREEAEACDLFLQRQGLIVRRVAGYNLPAALRITVGDEASCRRVAHAIGQFKAGER